MTIRPKLLFLSPRYLLPADSGGKIRTGQVLRGLKGGYFELILVSPAPKDGPTRDARQLAAMCDRFACWRETKRGSLFRILRMRHLMSRLPIPVATDISSPALGRVAAELAAEPDLIVVDFAHAAALLPRCISTPSVLFTHNVEAEIFARHFEIAANPLARAIWRNQLTKMRRFEKMALRRFDAIVAVSDRDKMRFIAEYGVNAEVIGTGVDLDFFKFEAPEERAHPEPNIVFTASMDSYANIDAIQWFMDSVWPLVAAGSPSARVTVVGRSPDPKLVQQARDRRLPWVFTGSVEDVRPYVYQSTVYIIPLRVGGGTRIKAYEAIALGRPVVSTTVGVEGLQLEPGRHYFEADSACDFAASVLHLLRDGGLRVRLATQARAFVEKRFSSEGVAKAFEAICRNTLQVSPERGKKAKSFGMRMDEKVR